jgi:hypothetical protein
VTLLLDIKYISSAAPIDDAASLVELKALAERRGRKVFSARVPSARGRCDRRESQVIKPMPASNINKIPIKRGIVVPFVPFTIVLPSITAIEGYQRSLNEWH